MAYARGTNGGAEGPREASDTADGAFSSGEADGFIEALGVSHGSLFYPRQRNNFGSQSFGVLNQRLLVEEWVAEEAGALERVFEEDPIGSFYDQRATIEEHLKALVCDDTAGLAVAFGPGCSYWLHCIARQPETQTVAFSRDEFLSTKMAFAGKRLVSFGLPNPVASDQAVGDSVVEQLAAQDNVDVFVLSLVNSFDQAVVQVADLEKILQFLFSTDRPGPLVFLDCAQALGNIDTRQYGAVCFGAGRRWCDSVAFVGSLVKHLRGQDGGCGFLVSTKRFGERFSSAESVFGWTRRVEWLKNNQVVTEGAPGPMFPLDGYTPPARAWLVWEAMFRRVVRGVLMRQKGYIRALHAAFFAEVTRVNEHSLFRETAERNSAARGGCGQWSNTLVFEVSERTMRRGSEPAGPEVGALVDKFLQQLRAAGFCGVDSKQKAPACFFLRVGFGIQNLPYSCTQLARAMASYEWTSE